jgi:hypothetical protein
MKAHMYVSPNFWYPVLHISHPTSGHPRPYPRKGNDRYPGLRLIEEIPQLSDNL